MEFPLDILYKVELAEEMEYYSEKKKRVRYCKVVTNPYKVCFRPLVFMGRFP